MRIYSAVIVLLLCSLAFAQGHEHRASGQPAAFTPLVLQKEEGERRVRRQRPASVDALAVPFIIKVDRFNGGSPNFMMGYEDIPAGRGIPRHYHPPCDEILFIHRGSGLATLGERQVEVREGATIYIPPNTRVSLKNTGTSPLTVLFFFPDPAMADYFRDGSVREGEAAKPFTEEEFAAFRARHSKHIVFEELPGARINPR